MTVNSHLNQLARNLTLIDKEKIRVENSINTLSSRLNLYFNNNEIKRHFKFGSYTRSTILPRTADTNSDVDYMVIFNNPNEFTPQTLMNHLRSFVKYYYSTSDISQSHPTIVLNLNHIKFELVPAREQLHQIYIPSRTSDYMRWMSTNPKEFDQRLTQRNVANDHEIKPLIRLMKYWNSRSNNHYLNSYVLEEWITNNYYFGISNLKEYVYSAFDRLNYNLADPQYYKSSVDSAKSIINQTKQYERNEMPASAEREIKRLLPSY